MPRGTNHLVDTGCRAPAADLEGLLVGCWTCAALSAPDRRGKAASSVDELKNLKISPDSSSTASCRPRRRRGSNMKHQPYQRRTMNLLLKKDSPDSPEPPNHHHDGLTKSFTSERLALRRSTEARNLQKKGRTALLEMLILNPLPCHTSCHGRRTTRKMKMRARLTRLMELSGQLHVAMEVASLLQTLLLYLVLPLYRWIRRPSTSLRPPARAPVARVAGSGLAAATLNGRGGGAFRTGGVVGIWF
jgi:hypothetical protein